MKRLLLLGFTVASATGALAQADVKIWTRLAGTTTYDFGYAVAADRFGNAVVAGATQGSLGGGNAGRYDLFVAKYDAAGTRLWLRQRGTAEREFAYGVATDSAGNVYATGYTGAGLDGNSHIGNWDVFFMKFDPAGNWQWTKQVGTSQDDEGRAVTTDAAGNIFITGYVRGDFHGIPRVGSADVFISKYNAAGTRLWSALFGSENIDESFGIACDPAGNVIVTGWCDGSIEGNPYLSNGDNFLAKYDANGQRVWLKQWGTFNKDTGYSLACDATGNIYLSGYTTGPLYGTPLGERDIFLAKFDPDGNLIWGRQFGTAGHDQGWGNATDPAGNVYVAGETSGALDGNPYQGGLDIFLTKYNPAGTRLWTTQLGTAAGDLARGVAVATNGTVFVAGWTSGGLEGQSNAGLDDAFITKFAPATTVPPLPPVARPASGVTSNAFTANWSAAYGATGYRLDVSTNVTFSDFLSGYDNLNVGDVTNRNVTGLTPTLTYYYRVRAYNTNGTSGNSATMAVTLASANPCAALVNAGFEDGFVVAGGGFLADGWTEWEADPGVIIGYDETALVRSGSHAQRLRVWGGTNGSAGGVYQRLPVAAGNNYTISVWLYAGDAQTACSLGVDPAGGTNAGSGVIWSSASTNVAWVQKTWTGLATANLLTVYLKVASSDSTKRNGYFDDAAPAAVTEPPPLAHHRDGENLVLTWPECPPTRLEQTDDLTPPVNWQPATNAVVFGGGQKTVTVTPVGAARYFRLALE